MDNISLDWLTAEGEFFPISGVVYDRRTRTAAMTFDKLAELLGLSSVQEFQMACRLLKDLGVRKVEIEL
jgi:hypothetical protein